MQPWVLAVTFGMLLKTLSVTSFCGLYIITHGRISLELRESKSCGSHEHWPVFFR